MLLVYTLNGHISFHFTASNLELFSFQFAHIHHSANENSSTEKKNLLISFSKINCILWLIWKQFSLFLCCFFFPVVFFFVCTSTSVLSCFIVYLKHSDLWGRSSGQKQVQYQNIFKEREIFIYWVENVSKNIWFWIAIKLFYDALESVRWRNRPVINLQKW